MRRACGLLAALALLALAGCGHLDLTPEGDASRVLAGRIDMGEDAALPADATVTVRVIDSTATGMPPRVFGSQTLTHPGASPIEFRVDYQAQDEDLRRGLNIEVRISWGGRVRYYNMNAYAVTLSNASDVHRVSVNRVGP